jgi:hypothetical protein
MEPGASVAWLFLVRDHIANRADTEPGCPSRSLKACLLPMEGRAAPWRKTIQNRPGGQTLNEPGKARQALPREALSGVVGRETSRGRVLVKVRARSGRGTPGGGRSCRGAGRALRGLGDAPEVRREVPGSQRLWDRWGLVKESIGLDPFRLGGDRGARKRVAHLRSIQIQKVKGDVDAHGQEGAEEHPPPASRPSPVCLDQSHDSPQRATRRGAGRMLHAVGGTVNQTARKPSRAPPPSASLLIDGHPEGDTDTGGGVRCAPTPDGHPSVPPGQRDPHHQPDSPSPPVGARLLSPGKSLATPSAAASRGERTSGTRPFRPRVSSPSCGASRRHRSNSPPRR